MEPGISRPTLAGDRASSAGPQNTISQIPPNTATAPIHSVGWELSSELLTWYFSGAPLRNRTVDLLLTMHAGSVRRRRITSNYRSSEGSRCLGTSRCVGHSLESLSLTLSLAPGPPPFKWRIVGPGEPEFGMTIVP